jgi:hypothetical protein
MLSSGNIRLIVLGHLYFFSVFIFSIIFRFDHVITTTLFFLVPTIILCTLKRGFAKEILLFSISMGIPLGLYVQVIAERNNLWKYEPVHFKNFFINGMPMEALFWYPVWIMLLLSVYVYFIDNHKHLFKKHFIKRHFRYFLFSSVLLLISLALAFLEEKYLQLQYAYTFLVLPLGLLAFLLYRRKLHKRYFKIMVPTTLIYLIPMLVYDVLGVYLNSWEFGGQYFGLINLGIGLIPIEELVIWLIICTPAIIIYFEEFESDFK